MSANEHKLYNVPAKETERVYSNHINGNTEEKLARQSIIELCKGWPVYRDFSEWHNYRSLFTREDAYVWTSKSIGLRGCQRSSLINTSAQLGLAVSQLMISLMSPSKAVPPATLSHTEKTVHSPMSISAKVEASAR